MSSIEIVEPKLFAGVVADEIVASLSESIAEKGSASLVLAGGRTPSVVYRALSLPPRVEEVPWSNVRVYWGDERWVPVTDNESNQKMVQETMLSHLPKPGPHVFPVNTALTSPEKGAEEYERMIRSGENSPTEPPVFDVVLLGLGEDGHFASIFPGSGALHEAARIVVAVPGPGGQGMRISLTPKALLNARRVLFIVRGENKSLIIKRILEGSDAAEDLPGRLAAQAGGNVTWFIDSAAAQRLTPRKG